MTHDEEIKIEAEAESEEASEQEGVQQEKAKVEMREENTPKESEDMKEKMLRLAAEFDNYKKRTRKEVEEAGIIGKANLVKEILPVIDGFQLAIVAMEKSEDKEMVKGVEMLYSNLMETLKRSGLAEVKTGREVRSIQARDTDGEAEQREGGNDTGSCEEGIRVQREDDKAGVGHSGEAG